MNKKRKRTAGLTALLFTHFDHCLYLNHSLAAELEYKNEKNGF